MIRRPNKQRGVLSIEFALGAFVLFLTTFAIFEMSRFIYIINLTEAALSESVRDTKVFESERMNLSYSQRLSAMFSQQGQVWHSLVEVNRYHFSRHEYPSLQALEDNTPSVNCPRCPIVQIELSYDYQPVYFVGAVGNRTIRRSLLSVQEHEGWQDAQ
ncbi:MULTISPECIES: TadE/TadG family type IV pilus assembly protein [Ferrimonas]|uniref:TadE/TadG family type IV pilus assembly protein n=1 Tax=Ferrimonas TaxID=44011 RepID=UPI000411D3C5|nr:MULTISPECIES: TadE family protein [Ferrimonas]USD38802.1 pilus assembly protein [Ferrimonas sp. SCSIO 43195]